MWWINKRVGVNLLRILVSKSGFSQLFEPSKFKNSIQWGKIKWKVEKLVGIKGSYYEAEAFESITEAQNKIFRKLNKKAEVSSSLSCK